MILEDKILCKGDVQAIIEWEDGRRENIEFTNTILRNGRSILALALANRIGDSFDYFISRMLFGDGGTSGGVPKTVSDGRTGLFGTTQVSKPVISIVDPTNSTQVVFNSVISFSEGNGVTLNEMALQMNNGDLYSMATFPGISKTSQMQIIWNWRLSFI